MTIYYFDKHQQKTRKMEMTIGEMMDWVIKILNDNAGNNYQNDDIEIDLRETAKSLINEL